MTKEERKEYNVKYRVEHRQEIKEYKIKYRLAHQEEIKEWKSNYRAEHKDEMKEYDAKRRAANKETIKEQTTKYYITHKEEKKKYNAKYRIIHKQETKVYYGKYKRQRKLVDPLYRMKTNLRNRTRLAFKRIGLNKPTKSETLLGADFKTVMRHIESKFIFGMSWKNYGKWHIDHKKPLALAKTEKQLIKLCHYTNLQPLWAEENLSKSKKINYVIKEVRFG